jgi:hypothetical protein
VRRFVLLFVLFTSTASAAEPSEHCPTGWESTVFLNSKSSVVRISDGGGWGAGFFWKTRTRIVTAMHVVASARSFEIVFADGTHGRAHLVAGDEKNDVAILELDGSPPSGTAPLELADPASLSIGEPLIALGHPLAGGRQDERDEGLFTWSITRGVLAARNEHQVQVDIRVTHGNSGGPILDCEGRVIGVVSHGVGTLNFATGPRDLIALDANPRVPGISLSPTSALLRIGLSLRRSTFTSYGPTLEGGVTFFGRLDVALRATGLFSVSSETSSDRIVTGRSGGHLWLGGGLEFRVLRGLVVPNVGASGVVLREHASRSTPTGFVDDSQGQAAVRLTPGVTLMKWNFWFDYKMEIDFGKYADSAHLFTLGLFMH